MHWSSSSVVGELPSIRRFRRSKAHVVDSVELCPVTALPEYFDCGDADYIF